jgi:hypothetical protein
MSAGPDLSITKQVTIIIAEYARCWQASSIFHASSGAVLFKVFHDLGPSFHAIDFLIKLDWDTKRRIFTFVNEFSGFDETTMVLTPLR